MTGRKDNLQSSASFLDTLEGVIHERMRCPVDGSYVSGLIRGGNRRLAQKVGEEAVELALAAAAGDRDEQVEEAADLLFHLLVLLNCNGIRLADVVHVLAQRRRARPERDS